VLGLVDYHLKIVYRMKKATLLLGTLACVSALAAPMLTHAEMYEYVNTSGNLETVTADTASDALQIPTDKAPNSGVIPLIDLAVVNTYPVTVTTTPVITYPVTTTTTSEPSTSVSTTYTASSTLPQSDVGTYYSATTTAMNNSGTNTTYSPGVLNMTLSLNQSGSAYLTTNYTNGQTAETQNGTWSAITNNGGNQIQLNLNANSTDGSNTANTIIFDQNGTTLTAASYPTQTYPYGLVFTM
jgi:hypothetical protein